MKRSIALLLVLAMAFSLCCISAAAEGDEKDTLVYTALGDSASNGYGMTEYGTRTYIYGQKVPGAYPTMFANAIGATTYNQDCLSGLRSEDLRYLLDPERYPGDSYTWSTAFGGYVMGSIAKDGITGVKHLSDLYIQHVTEADVITLNIGLNNFGNFLAWQVEDYLNSGTPFNEVSLNPEMEAMLKTPELMQMHDELMKLFAKMEIAGLTGDKIAYIVENLLHSFAYSYVDHFECIDAIIERIYELNPDVDLYVLGLYDCFPTLCLTNDMINIGKLCTVTMESVNTHLKYFAPHCCEYTYVDVLNTEIFGVPTNLTDPDFIAKFTANNGAAVHPSYNGHIYMFNQLMAKYHVPFKDVSNKNDNYDAIAFAYNTGAIEASSTAFFMPDLITDRAAIANALYVIAGRPSTAGMTEPFIDVNQNTKYYDAIVWVYNMGIMSGTSSKVFSPCLSANRSTFAAALYAYAGSPAVGNVSIKDINIVKSAHRDAVKWAVQNGIFSLNSLGYVNPGLLVTREELAEAVYALR